MNYLTPLTVSAAFLFLVVAGAALIIWAWHKDNDTFDLRQALVDSVTGKLSVEKAGFVVALAFSTWTLVTLVLNDKLTEWFFTAYLGVFGVTRVASQALSVIKDTKATNA